MKEKKPSDVKIILLAWLALLPGIIFAQDKVCLEDKLIGSTFKVLAKGFVAVADIGKLKKNNITKLNKMDEDKFRKRYAEVYQAIKDLPQELKAAYAITEDMTKEQAIRDIKSLDKQKIYVAIDSVSDTIIARHFKHYLAEKKHKIQKSNIVEQINIFWAKLIAKAK